MSRPIRYQRRYSWLADKVYAATVDPAQLRARLAELGGRQAALLEHEQTDRGARFRLLHGLASADLPAIARTVLPDDVMIERTEVWRLDGPGRYSGDVQVGIGGMPAEIGGRMTLTDAGPGGSELRVDGQVSVRLPLVGGKIEEIVATQVTELLAAETGFTERWLTS